MQPLDDNLIRDGLQFKRDLGSPNSSLSCFRQGLFVLREHYIDKAKAAHGKRNEERASYYMGIVEGIDLCIRHPEVMANKWERLAKQEIYAVSSNGGDPDGGE